MNANNPYSPLKHHGKWTLVIKMYRAPTRMMEIRDKHTTASKDPTHMFDGMTKASEALAAVLRNPQLNFDAYVLHTNYASLVTVGLFDSEKDQRMTAMQTRLATLKLQITGPGSTPEDLMSPPLPIQIPRAK